MRRLLLTGGLCLLLVMAACGGREETVDEPARSDITIVAEGGQQSAEISVGMDAASVPEAQPDAPAPGGVHTDTTGHFEDDMIASIPRAFDVLIAGMTMTYDAEGNETYADGARTVTSYEWYIDGTRAHQMTVESDAYRYIAAYTPKGRLMHITAVPLATIDPNVCPDAYAVYTELYFYGDTYYGYLYYTERDSIITQQNYGPDHAPVFTCVLTVNVYGESVESALYDEGGTLICKAIGAEDAGEDTRIYQDGSGNTVSLDRYDELVLDVCGDWLNEYYGNIYGA